MNFKIMSVVSLLVMSHGLFAMQQKKKSYSDALITNILTIKNDTNKPYTIIDQINDTQFTLAPQEEKVIKVVTNPFSPYAIRIPHPQVFMLNKLTLELRPHTGDLIGNINVSGLSKTISFISISDDKIPLDLIENDTAVSILTLAGDKLEKSTFKFIREPKSLVELSAEELLKQGRKSEEFQGQLPADIVERMKEIEKKRK